MTTWAERYKLVLRITLLALLVALPVVWIRKTQTPTAETTPPLPKTTVAKTAVKGASTVFNKDFRRPRYNYTLPLGDGYKLSVRVIISSLEEPEEGAYWCGAPFLLDYKGDAKARIEDNSGKVEDEMDLTDPSLVLGNPPDYDYYYYKTYDFDGDNNNHEFIVLDYSSCNGNWVRIVKADAETRKFVTIPFQIKGEEKEKILTGPNKEDLVFSSAQLSTKTYDMTNSLFSVQKFFYQDGTFIQTSKSSER